MNKCSLGKPLYNDDALQAEDLRLRDECVKRFKLKEWQRDFNFILIGLRNTVNNYGQICLAVAPTAVFDSGECLFIAAMDPAFYFSKIQYIVDPNKLKGYGLDKFFLEKLPTSYYDYRKMNLFDSLKLKHKGNFKLALSSKKRSNTLFLDAIKSLAR